MALKRRDLFKAGAAAGSLAMLSSGAAHSEPARTLKPITGDVEPISVSERRQRIARAQGLMQHLKIDALLLEPGSAMLYFTGISWWRSERLTAVILPKEGDITVITPFFEEPSVRESMTFGDDVRTWHENEDPFALLAGLFREHRLSSPRIALEGSVRYFVVEGIERSLPGAHLTGGEAITRACRMLKSPAELALMHKANEVTLTAYAHVYAKLEKGMQPEDVNAMMRSAQAELGGSGIWTMALFGEASAYPHGSGQPQEIREGQIVLMDCGCAVEGYQSDISRTFVYGEPSAEQERVWQLVRRGQDIALTAARPGAAAGTVDDAVRTYYTAQGFGPGYQLPGLSTRTGHGIGMDGHEQINFVQGEETPLVEGMCFSNEPGIYIPGKFGVRLEDCLHMGATGPVWFTVPPDSLAEPIGKMGPAIEA
ncbi:aminopeptidase P family protein [Parahaliea maris]|uniref:Aminopeptidase P family protein n=1 Tax=Parahaliea maris TaxID=2716870 RepID=A0A5C8ZKE2_9GAMM|nr:Xaa-Pro peptidase family protein [Parahaliea maris]TXS88928.1 aminopeptidase P family protein [Parahaliea maris]